MAAHDYQLLIKNILKSPIAQASRKQIVFRGAQRFSYPEFVDRVHRLGAVLQAAGAKQGTRIAVMDWDSHRYLEAYFAVPAIGAVLMMVNIRLSPEQIAYTVDHAEAEILLGGTGVVDRAAGANDLAFHIFGVDIRFHGSRVP